MTSTDSPGLVDLRSDPAVRAGALAWESPDVTTGWHRHPYHQLEYALTGVAEVETSGGRFLLPSQRAIWVPAGVEHNTTLRGVSSVSIFFHPEDLPSGSTDAAVVAVTPLLREMIRYSTRWPIDRHSTNGKSGEDTGDDSAAFFGAVGIVIAEALEQRLPFHLPSANDPLVEAVLRETSTDLVAADLAAICEKVGVSQRTLRRRIRADIGMSWAEYLTQARVMRAVSMLAAGEESVLEVTTAVGFSSPSGFTRAFRRLTGLTPGAYRKERWAA